LWRHLQQAYVGYEAPLGLGLQLQAGLFLSPIGMEGIAVKDNRNWSRSDLFFALPAYHAGLRGTQQLTERLSVTAAVYNGWNSVVDNNEEKSLSMQLLYADPDALSFAVLYFGGVERPDAAPEGQPWRHLFDAWVQVRVADPLWLAAHGDAGFEQTDFGTSSWAGGAVYAQARAATWLYFAARGDYFSEYAAVDEAGAAGRIFWPGDWVASVTGTVDVRPSDNISARLEVRHDRGATEMFFSGDVAGDGSADAPFVPTARSQTTLTLGATAWF
jgi:hypothetical protein